MLLSRLLSRLILVTVSSSALLLASCATLSVEECMVGNWQAIGYNDGVAGYPPSRLAAHSKACAKANVAADYESWERGRQLGLKQYCTVNNAYNIGRRGLELNRVCPASSTKRLQQANQQGREYYRLNKQLNDDRALLEEYEADYTKLRAGQMLDFEDEKEARRYLLSLPAELRRLEREIIYTERQLSRLNDVHRD